MPTEIQDLLASAKTHRESGDGEKLVEVFEKLQALQPDERNWKVAAACALGELGRVEDLNDQIKTLTLNAQEATMVASALHTGGAMDAATDLLVPVLDDNPFDEGVVNKLASILIQKGERDEATRVLKNLLTRPMDDHHAAARTWFNLGVASDSPEESEQAYFRSLELYPEYELPVANLGLLLTKTGQLQKAIEFLQPKVDAGIDWPRTAILLSTAYRLNNEQDLAVAILRKIVESNDQSMEHMEMAWEILVRCLVESENDEEAVSRCKEWKAKMPESAVAEHMLAAIVGKDAPSRASSKYVADTFDSFAESFDSVLTNLEYCAPQLVGKLVGESLGEPKGDLVVLDAGCGTGLAGPLLRPFAKSLLGVDLSAGMLAQAETRGIYDSLLQADLVEHLHNSKAKYGLIAAADTFNYFGDLSELLPACFSALTHDGWLVFTLEFGETYGETWQLEPHGRYSHPPGYLMERLGECGIESGEMITATLRKENGVDVQGLLIAVQNPACNAGN
jgi:predicted TPR repeat methyltransferase